jgi:quinol monooxygenase YgiN
MRVNVLDFEGVKGAMAKFAGQLKNPGCQWTKAYQAEKVPHDILFLMEWENHAAFEASNEEVGEEFIALVQPVSEWDDVI